MKTVFNRIRKRRKELGLTQEELAHKVGYKNKEGVCHVEKGDVDIPLSKLIALSKALDVPIGYFFEDEDCVIDDIPF